MPVKDPDIIRTICDQVLPVYLADNVKARQMNSNGVYVRRKTGGKHPVNSQEVLLGRRGTGTRKVKHARSRTQP